MLVSNGQYFQFVQDGGYTNPLWWNQEGRAWLASVKQEQPLFWIKSGNGAYKLRTIFQEVNMPWDWPVQVNNLEARAFCKWRT